MLNNASMFAGPMGIIPMLKEKEKHNKEKIYNKCTKVSRKQFGGDRVGLCAKRERKAWSTR